MKQIKLGKEGFFSPRLLFGRAPSVVNQRKAKDTHMQSFKKQNKKKLTKQGQWVLFSVWRRGLALIKVGDWLCCCCRQ